MLFQAVEMRRFFFAKVKTSPLIGKHIDCGQTVTTLRLSFIIIRYNLFQLFVIVYLMTALCISLFIFHLFIYLLHDSNVRDYSS